MKGNAGEYQGNAGEYRGIQGNARGMYGSGCKVPAECWGILGNAGICQWNVQEWVQSMRGIQGNARGTYCSGYKGPGNAGECRGTPGERMGVGVNCQGNAGNAGSAGEYQGNVREVYSARGMQGTTRGMQGSGCKMLAE